MLRWIAISGGLLIHDGAPCPFRSAFVLLPAGKIKFPKAIYEGGSLLILLIYTES
jgi:hypothetical protein